MFSLALLMLTPVADPKPTEAEMELITLVTKLGGTADIDRGLDEEARVAVTFEKPTDADLLALAKQPAVGSLDLRSGVKVTDKGFAALKELPDLQKLFVSGGTVTATEAAAIGTLRPLGTLVLGGCKITDAEVAAFKKLKNLKEIDLLDTAVTDRCVESLLALTKLEGVNLSGTKVSDAGAKKLLGLESLRLLQLNNSKVTADGVAAMEDELKSGKRVVRIQR